VEVSQAQKSCLQVIHLHECLLYRHLVTNLLLDSAEHLDVFALLINLSRNFPSGGLHIMRYTHSDCCHGDLIDLLACLS